MTVAGPIDASALGVTSMHEHLLIGMPGWEYDTSYKYDRKTVVKKCVEQVLAAKEYGLNSFVDATPSDLSRDPELFKAIWQETGVNVICATGLYTQAEGNNAFWRLLKDFKGYDEAFKRLTESYIKDIEVGIGDSGVKCGVIKLSAGKNQISDFELLSIHAGVQAQKETETPIISHTGSPDVGPEMARHLIEYGADPGKTMIGHMCDTDDIACLESTLSTGVYIGMDRFGLDMIFCDDKKCNTLCALVEMGYIEQLLLGHDCTIFNHAGDLVPEANLAAMPYWNMSGLFRKFLPECRELGLSESQVHTLLVDNPRRFFSK